MADDYLDHFPAWLLTCSFDEFEAVMEARRGKLKESGWVATGPAVPEPQIQRAKTSRPAPRVPKAPEPVDLWSVMPDRWFKRSERSAVRAKKKTEKRKAKIARHKAKACKTVEGIGFLALDPCVYCGDRHPTTHDHIEPVSKGGAHDLSNLARCCRRCNFEKATFSLIVFLARRAGKRAA